MPSLLLVVLLVEVAVHLVNTIGAATINNLVRQKTRHGVHPPDWAAKTDLANPYSSGRSI